MRGREILGLGGPLLVLFVLSIYQLGALSFWRDEVASVVFASGSVPELVAIIGRDREAVGLANMATYYLLLHFWMLVDQGEAWVRLLSVIFGTATVVPVYFIARRLAGWQAATLAAAIFALIPFVVHYNQEARGYSLSMLVAAGMTWLLLVATDGRQRWWPWLAYGVLAALGLYVHFFVALVVAAHGLWVLATRQIPPLRHALAGLLPIGLAAAPIPFIIAEFGGEQEWVPPLTPEVAARGLIGLAGSPALLLAMSLVLGLGMTRLAGDRRAWLLVGSILLPIAGAVLISLVKPMFVGRYLIMVLPMLAVFVAWTIVTIGPVLVRAGVAVGLGVLLVLAVPSAYADGHQQDWRSAARWMAGEVRAGDAMIAQNGRRSLEYYLDRSGGMVPPSTRVALALGDPQISRVWVAVLGDLQPGYDAEVPQRLSPRYEVTTSRTFGPRLTILLMTQRAARGAAG